jgi:hypothetical protein
MRRLDASLRFVKELNVGAVDIWEVPGCGLEEGAQACCKAFINVKAYSLPWWRQGER